MSMSSSFSKSRLISLPTALHNISRLTSDTSVEIDQIRNASPVHIPRELNMQCAVFYEHLYPKDALISCTAAQISNGSKSSPTGKVHTSEAHKLAQYAKADLLAEVFDHSGGYARINPVKQRGGSGRNHCYIDQDIASFDFMLFESDVIEMSKQLACLVHLNLPISAIVDSGGKSYHALVKLSANSLEDYREKASAIYRLLVLVGADPSNKNPSRFTRVPGVRRSTPAKPEGVQSLIYLDPTPDGRPIVSRL